MSLLTPERVPVKVYKWDDVDAPILDKKPSCIATILKACLVTGYGDKEGAGWMLAHEDLVTNTKVFNVNSSVEPPLYLRCYNDTGQTMGVQLCKDVVDANTVTSVAECPTVFKYMGHITTGEWMVIASDRGFWFFAQVAANDKTPTRSGAFLFAGIVPGVTTDGFVIKHTGGVWGDTDDDREGLTTPAPPSASSVTPAAAYNLASNVSASGDFNYICNGVSNVSDVVIAAPIYFTKAGDVYRLPIHLPSRNDLNNFAPVPETMMINFCTSMQYKDTGENTYVPTDSWEY